MKSIILINLLLISILHASSNGFQKAKNKMYKVWSEHPYTFYCNCKYDRNKKNMIDRESCGYKPKNPITKKGKQNKRAYRTEAEHIVPAENFYRQLECSRTSKQERKGLSKRNYCYKVNKTFRTFHDDIRNLVPAIGELNANRSNYRFGALDPKIGDYGKCQFQIENRKAYVSKDIRGDIARTYFYIRDKYGYKMSKQEIKMMEVWNKLDPIDEWEKKRNNL